MMDAPTNASAPNTIKPILMPIAILMMLMIKSMVVSSLLTDVIL